MHQLGFLCKIFHTTPSLTLLRISACRTFSFSSSEYVQLRDELIYTSEHYTMRDSLRKLIESEINPYVDEWEKQKRFPAHKVFKKLGQTGFLGVDKPTDYGGLGLDFTYSVAIAEEIGSINCGGVTSGIGVQTDMATPALVNFGSDFLKREFLAPTISGDVVACVGVSEAHAGSDVAGIKTTAKRSGDDLIINGSKMWITNGCQADWMCLLANTSDSAGKGPHKNKSLICAPMKLKGIHIAKSIEKLGLHSSDTAEIYFEDVRVPVTHIIGESDFGFVYQMMQFQVERLWAVASCLLPMERIIEKTIDYAKSRKIYGRPLLDNQYIHYRLAELQTEIEMLRSTLYRATKKYVAGENVTLLASMCKLKAGRLMREVADSCLQIWGGMGYSEEGPMARAFRDTRIMSIAGGADEVMLAIICKYMDTLPKKN